MSGLSEPLTVVWRRVVTSEFPADRDVFVCDTVDELHAMRPMRDDLGLWVDRCNGERHRAVWWIPRGELMPRDRQGGSDDGNS